MDKDIISSINVLNKEQFCGLLTERLKLLGQEQLLNLYRQYCKKSDYEEMVLKNKQIVQITYKPIQPGESNHIIVGIYYELPDKSICTISGADCVRRKVTYHLENSGSLSATFKEVSKWKPRRDLQDWPNAEDPIVPYIFDLYWDIKRISDLRRVLKEGHTDINHIRDLIHKHNLFIPD